MKTRAVTPAVIVLLLLLGSAALAQSGGPLDGYTAKPGPALSIVEGPALSIVEGPALSIVEGPALSIVEGTASGGGYRLTVSSWQVSGIASGEGYRLLSPLAPSLQGSGCCCTFLPCVMRNY